MNPNHRVRRGPVAARLLLLPLLGLVVLAAAGCASHTPAPKMAASQPEAKDLSVLREGTPRHLVVAQLGQPIWSGEDSQGRVDIFEFKQGYARATKTMRAVLHGLADILTIGLWEIIGEPIEMIYSGKTMRVEVMYDAQERVKLTRTVPPGEATSASPTAPPKR